MKKIILIFLILLLTACSKEEKLTKYQNTSLNGAFDTVSQLIGYTASENEFDQYFSLMEERLLYYHQLFDKYNTYEGINNVKTINDNAGIKEIKVDQELIEILEASLYWYDKSNGYFNVMLGPTLEIWHNYREEGILLNEKGQDGNIPSKETIETAQKCSLIENLVIDKDNSTVYLKDSCAKLDLGGIAKGYAAEKIAQELEDKGLKSGILNAGGNVRTIGNKPDQSSWKIGIQNPDNQGGIEYLVFNDNNSMVTSGDYERYYTVDGTKYHHLIDPKTGYPANHYRATIILTKNSGSADALSTIAFTMPFEQSYQLISSLEDVGCIWVFDKDKVPTDLSNVFSYEIEEQGKNYIIVATESIIDKLDSQK